MFMLQGSSLWTALDLLIPATSSLIHIGVLITGTVGPELQSRAGSNISTREKLMRGSIKSTATYDCHDLPAPHADRFAIRQRS
jgi:hypothetical protein